MIGCWLMSMERIIARFYLAREPDSNQRSRLPAFADPDTAFNGGGFNHSPTPRHSRLRV